MNHTILAPSEPSSDGPLKVICENYNDLSAGTVVLLVFCYSLIYISIFYLIKRTFLDSSNYRFRAPNEERRPNEIDKMKKAWFHFAVYMNGFIVVNILMLPFLILFEYKTTLLVFVSLGVFLVLLDEHYFRFYKQHWRTVYSFFIYNLYESVVKCLLCNRCGDDNDQNVATVYDRVLLVGENTTLPPQAQTTESTEP